jgi:hypothetical protein
MQEARMKLSVALRAMHCYHVHLFLLFDLRIQVVVVWTTMLLKALGVGLFLMIILPQVGLFSCVKWVPCT